MVVFIIIFILAARAFGITSQSGRVKTTRPDPKSVDGFGGNRGYDYSSSGWPAKVGKGPLSVREPNERKRKPTRSMKIEISRS